MTDFEAIDYRLDRQVAWVTLNRPDARNAINDQMRGELFRVLEDARTNPEVRALVLTGSGKGFCTGADLSGPRKAGGPAGPVAPVVGGGAGNPGGLDGQPPPSGVHGAAGAGVTGGRRLPSTNRSPPSRSPPIAAATAPQRSSATP